MREKQNDIDILKMLLQCKDEEYAAFQIKLTPGIPAENFIGVRVPKARKLAKELIKNGGYEAFLGSLPHRYYDENMLHGLLVSEMNDYNTCLYELERFLPYVDNWAVCDIMSPKVFKKNKGRLLIKIKEWILSAHTYTCRFGIEMLMTHFLDNDFDSRLLELIAVISSDEYYVNMMIAWFYATALSKQWEATIPYLENNRLSIWTHNKTIQKARESFRITAEQKDFLKTLKR